MSNTNKRFISVQVKILAAVIMVFLIAMAVVTGYSAQQQKAELLQAVEAQAGDLINSYFDSMNTMMFTGTMAKREILREKLEGRDEVLEIRMLRGDPVSKLFGPGFEHEKPVGDAEVQALQGKRVFEVVEVDGHRELNIIQPFHALTNYNGTNCITCHQVEEGTVLGAVHLRYSLETRDAAVERSVIRGALMNLGVFVVGLILLTVLVRHIVIKPLNILRQTVETVEGEVDLRPRVQLSVNDEFGNVGTAVNSMLDRFRSTIHELMANMEGLVEHANGLSRVAEQSETGIVEQEKQTKQLTLAVSELSTAAQDVASSAARAEEAARQALTSASDGQNVVSQVVNDIALLAGRIENAGNVVKELAEGTSKIGQVSEAITAIAEQTNLLALNAAIEAARAGEQGRGFAVVADEVRSLAQRTQEATQEIRNIIEQLRNSSEEAVKVMEEGKTEAEHSVTESRLAGNALQEIAASVSSITDMNTRIATAAEEQSAMVEEVDRNIVSINGVVHKTAEGSRQTARSSEELASVAGRLEQMINQFKT